MFKFCASCPGLGHTVCLLRSRFSKMEISKQAMCPEWSRGLEFCNLKYNPEHRLRKKQPLPKCEFDDIEQARHWGRFSIEAWTPTISEVDEAWMFAKTQKLM